MEYQTRIINKSSNKLMLLDDDRRQLVNLGAGEEFTYETADPKNYLARYRRIEQLPGPRIQLEINRAWENPFEDTWFLEALNEASYGGELLRVEDRYYFCAFGISRFIPVNIHDRMIWFQKVFWKLEKIVQPRIGRPGEVRVFDSSMMIKILRKDKEIEKIKAELARLEQEKIRRDMPKAITVPQSRGSVLKAEATNEPLSDSIKEG